MGSEGIDQLREKVKATTRALISRQNDPPHAVGSEKVEGGVNRTKFKNPPTKDPKGRPKDKVGRLKTIVRQAKDKAIKKNKSKARKTKAKDLACLVCHEEGHGVETCKYMAAAMHLRDPELKL